MKLIIVFCLTGLILFPSVAISSEEYSNIFFEANQAYNKGEYEKAISLYEKLPELGIRNGLIYYNIGNCYYRNGEIGKAILNYRKSELYNPRDEDLIANLTYARQNVKDKVEVSSSKILKRIFFWYYDLNWRELFILFLIFNGIFWTSAILNLFKPLVLLRTLLFVFLFIMLLTGISTAARFYTLKNLKDGVIIFREVSVRSGNSINNIVLFNLHEGTEIEILDEKNDWLKIKLPHIQQEMKGWVERKYVGMIN